MHLVAAGFQLGRVCQDDVRTVHSVLHVVDDHIVEHARVLVLVPYIQVDVLDAVVEDSLGNVQLGRFHLHGGEHLQEVQLGVGNNPVLEVEGCQRHQRHQDDEWSERADERDACCLDGK